MIEEAIIMMIYMLIYLSLRSTWTVVVVEVVEVVLVAATIIITLISPNIFLVTIVPPARLTADSPTAAAAKT